MQMRTLVRLAVATVVATVALVAIPATAFAATAIEYGLIAAL